VVDADIKAFQEVPVSVDEQEVYIDEEEAIQDCTEVAL
jgi:hypothetical protein